MGVQAAIVEADRDGEASSEPTVAEARPGRTPAAVVLSLTVLVAIPLVTALVALRDPAWLPVRDLAETELRVREVGSRHPPLVGLVGRLYGYGEHGNHPGPISFYALWPVYRLLGADGWALQASTAVVNLAAVALAVWTGHRRGGWPGALMVTAAMLLLLRAFGAVRLVEPWNPNLPLVWWFVFLLALWSLLCRDRTMLPVAVFAGTFCMQTHVPYVALVAGLSGATAVALAPRLRAAWRRPGSRRGSVRLAGGAAVLGGLLWLPPLVDQAVNRPGNAAIVVDNFRHPYDERAPFGVAFDVWLAHLDPRYLLRADLGLFATRLPTWPGVLLLGAWLVTVGLAWRRRDTMLLRLHAIVGLAAVFGLVATSRIFGPHWDYLTYWAWGTTALMLLAMVWTATTGPTAAADAEILSRRVAWRRPRPTTFLLGGAVVVLLGLFTHEAADSEMPLLEESQAVGPLVDAAAERLASNPAGCGDDCYYLVTWSEDRAGMGSGGTAVVLGLVRHGLDARALPSKHLIMRHRVITPEEADAEIHFALGDESVAQWRGRPDAEQIAFTRSHGEDGWNRAVFLVVR